MPRRAYSTLRSAPSHANSRACVPAPTASRVRTFRTRRRASSVARETPGGVDMVEHFAPHGEGCTQPIVGTLDTPHITIKHKHKPEKNEAKRHFGGSKEKGWCKAKKTRESRAEWGPQCVARGSSCDRVPPDDDDVEANRRGARPSRGE